MARGAACARALLACVAGALAISLNGASAQTRSLAQVERDRNAANARAQQLRSEAEAARAEIDALNARLVEAAARRTEAETQAADAETRLAALRLRLTTDGARYEREREAFEAAVIAAAFARRRLEPYAVRAGMFARAAAPELLKTMKESETAIVHGRRLDAAIAEEVALLADAQAAIEAERAGVEALVARRRAVQTALAADAAAAERRAQQFAAEARTLRELAERMAAQQARNAGPSGGGASAVPAAWLAPAEGRILRPYGSSIAGGPPTQGVWVGTRPGAQVVAPGAGQIAYAGAFRSYGQVLILNLDNGYALVLTGLATLRAQAGESVLAGQPLGEMAASDTPAPELYVEVRRGGQPIDPASWLAARGVAIASNGGRSGG